MFRRVIAPVILAAIAIASAPTTAQPVEPTNGPRHVSPNWHALTGATVTTSPGNTIENATLVFRDGAIVAAGRDIAIPEGARVWESEGLYVTPAFIEPFFEVDAPEPEAAGAHWNKGVKPQRSALDGGGASDGDASGLRSMGYAIANIAPKGGIFRGTSAVIALHSGDEAPSHHGVVLDDSLFHVASFDRVSGGYPGSQMGSIALVRQTLADVDWYASAHAMSMSAPGKADRPEDNAALRALTNDAPIMWDADDELQALRMIRHSNEFGRTPIVIGTGTEFRRLAAFKDADVRLVVPLTFPREPLVGTMADRESVTLRELQTWEQSPTNAWRLYEAGVDFSMTTSKRRKGEKFHDNLRKAIEHNLPEDVALAAMTTAPADLLGISGIAGTIEPGKLANFIVSDKPIFEKGAEIRDVWVEGVRYEINAAPAPTYEGDWLINGDEKFLVRIGAKNKVSVVDSRHGDDAKETYQGRNVTVSENRMSFDVDSEMIGIEGASMLVDAVFEGNSMHGTVIEPDGGVLEWIATRQPDGETEESEDDDAIEDDQVQDLDVPYVLPTPLGAFGYDVMPYQDSTLVINATIWTCGPEGIIEDGWLLADGQGKIEYVGPSRGEIPNDVNFVFDAEGKHVTPGLIDCHSHTGISGGVNEGTQAVTSEVRIADVINPDAIGWYRQLAGGITAVNQLHGSANPIGGQNSVVKIRWGAATADDMRIDDAIGGIKFALGENVKQSNWGGSNNTRYPQTRMGVETIIRDRFIAAREYGAAWDAYNKIPDREREGALPPRRDLELEALSEIIRGERLIHCHSYRQDEILMLCRVAEEFGFKIGTFQHVLEGYKVAEAIRENAIGASSFSDWWAYKFEVFDAIPDNGAIMHEVGVVVSFNSDSNELARRMNTEAAKAVKYGGVSEEEALKFVTLNPAKQLMIDHRVGSLEAGKDADFVIWSHHPLSTFARPELTVVESRMMFSLDKDTELRSIASAERQRLIQKIITPEPKKESKGEDEGDEIAEDEGKDAARDMVDSPPKAARFSQMQRLRAGVLTDEMLEREYRWMIENGLDPELARCGDCGCSVHSLFKRN